MLSASDLDIPASSSVSHYGSSTFPDNIKLTVILIPRYFPLTIPDYNRPLQRGRGRRREKERGEKEEREKKDAYLAECYSLSRRSTA